MEIGLLRIFIKPSEIFKISQEISWRDIFILMLIPSILFSIPPVIEKNTPIFLPSYIIGFYSLILYIAFIYSPIYYLFLRDYYSLKEIFKAIMVSSYPLFLMGFHIFPIMFLGFLLFHIIIFANIFQTIRDPLESFVITIFPSLLISVIILQKFLL